MTQPTYNLNDQADTCGWHPLSSTTRKLMSGWETAVQAGGQSRRHSVAAKTSVTSKLYGRCNWKKSEEQHRRPLWMEEMFPFHAPLLFSKCLPISKPYPDPVLCKKNFWCVSLTSRWTTIGPYFWQNTVCTVLSGDRQIDFWSSLNYTVNYTSVVCQFEKQKNASKTHTEISDLKVAFLPKHSCSSQHCQACCFHLF